MVLLQLLEPFLPHFIFNLMNSVYWVFLDKKLEKKEKLKNSLQKYTYLQIQIPPDWLCRSHITQYCCGCTLEGSPTYKLTVATAVLHYK